MIDKLAGGQLISPTGTHRCVQALVARGWSQSKISEALDVSQGNFWKMMQNGIVTVRLHFEVVALFDRWWNVEPSREEWRDKIAYSRPVAYAKARRWLPPLVGRHRHRR